MVLNGCSCTAVGVHILLKVRELLLRRTTADEHKARVFVPCSSGTAAAAALRSGGTGRCRLCIAGRILTAALAVVCTAALLCALALGGRLAVLAGRTVAAVIATAARALTAAGLLSLSAAYITDDDYRAELDLYPANIIYNIYLDGERTYQTNHYAETSKGFSFKAKKETAYDGREIYVMVVGETARAYEFSIYGYNRPTTPLMQRERGLVAFSNVMSQSNTTHKSVPMLLSAASATDYDRIYREKGIIEAFKEAGFHTTFISNQLPNHSFIDFFGEEADDWTFIKEHSKEGANTPDEEMLTILNKVLAKNRKRELIVLHCYGSHFNYRERYPRSEAFFRPDDASEAKASNRQQLVNAYDNSIRQTDRLLHDIIAALRKTGAVAAMLYTSDHGENIFDDDRKLFLHASPTPSYYELHVPLIAWVSESYDRLYPGIHATLVANRHKPVASSASFFHSMLGLAGISTPYRADSLNISSGKLHSAPRR